MDDQLTVSRARRGPAWVLLAAVLLGSISALAFQATPTPRRIVLVGDRPSHGPGQHEHNAGIFLLSKWLSKVPGVNVSTSYDGWPADGTLVDRADAIFMFCTGAENHIAFQGDHPAALQKAADRGAGLMFFHWCTEPPAAKGHQEMLDWVGGFFELNYSINPIFEADFVSLPNHPIARGVQPFTLRDEWYHNIRFAPKGVTPILTAIPPASVIRPTDSIRGGNPDVRAKVGQPQTVLWAYERPNGGRGASMTGGHFHENFSNENFRKVVMNALLWVARVEVPRDGVNVVVTPEEMKERLDPKAARGRGGN